MLPLGDTMEIEPEIPKHDKTPNLKLVMNPEGKLHDWSDLPDEEVPEMAQIAMVGNPELAQTLVRNLNEEKGRGKVSFMPVAPNTGGPQSFKATPSFAGGFRQVFDTRRGMFEQSVVGTRPNKTTSSHVHKLARSKTLPEIPQITEEVSLKRPHPSPSVPKRSSSKQMVAKMEQDNRRPLRSFFSNA